MQKKVILPIIFLATAVVGLFGAHTWLDKTVTHALIMFQNREILPGVFLKYRDIRRDLTCRIEICRILTDVTLSGNRFSFPLGTVFVSLKPLPSLTVRLKNTMPIDTKNMLQVDAAVSEQIIQIHNGTLHFNRLNATFNGLIDSKNPERTRLEAQTVGLKETLTPYLPQQIRFMAGLFFQDTAQKILIQVQNDWITLNNIPLLPWSRLSLIPFTMP